ncbi:hypothetical protein EPH05_03000 [Ureaplasma urealyticum]|uniref:hypothetical protein n=1 Tax=Ureaplasma urealyticum TaxID=2130 RepID=UPI00114F196B|nr:hypothetical protein [Ureaplasma urealyticum]QDI63907.1 hypothetical protein EPH05_03000 [Ureaplasma urealyticum]
MVEHKQKKTLKRCSSHFRKNLTIFRTLIELIKESSPFIAASVFTGLSLILIVVIVAHHKDIGAYAATSVSYLTIFQLSFLQLGTTFGIVFSVWSKRSFKDGKYKFEPTNDTANAASFYSFIFGLVVLLIYFTTSYIYNHFANDHQNTLINQNIGSAYIISGLAVVGLAPLRNYLLMLIRSNKSINILLAIVLDFCTWTTALIAAFLLGSYSSLGYWGYGLGMSIGFIFWTIIIGMTAIEKAQIVLRPLYISKKLFVLSIKLLWIQTILSSLKSVGKMFILLITFVVINERVVGSSLLDFQSSRILMYQSMIFIQMLNLGLSDFLFYLYQKQEVRDRRYHSRQLFAWIFIFGILFALVGSIIFGFSIKQLVELYTREQSPSYIFLEKHVPEHFYQSLRKILINDDELLNIIVNHTNINKDEIINALSSNDKNIWLPMAKKVIDPIWKLGDKFETIYHMKNPFTHRYVDISENNVYKYLIKNNAYILLTFFCTFFSFSSILGRYGGLIARRQRVPYVMIVIQLVMVAFTSGFGLTHQTDPHFIGLMAWSFPLFISSIFILGYSAYKILRGYLNYLKKHRYNDQKTSIMSEKPQEQQIKVRQN